MAPRRWYLIVPLVVLAGLLLIGAGRPAPDAPIALAETVDNLFPEGARFRLEVDSEEPVVEAHLNYRLPGSRSRTYAYLTLEPGRHTEGELTLKMSGRDYLPPGATIEYYYTLVYASGETLDTRPSEFTYLDTRFQWETAQVGPLILYWHDQPAEQVEETLQSTREALVRLSTLLGVHPDRPLRGTIYASQDEAVPAFPPTSETLTKEQVFAGYAFEQEGVFLGVEMTPRIVVHELAHLYLGLATAGKHNLLPSWVKEGFATYMEEPSKGWRQWQASMVGRQAMPLRAMNALPGLERDIHTFYVQSPTVVAYLLETQGEERFRTFLDSISATSGVDRALAAAYGFGLEELDRRWQEGISSPGRRWADVALWMNGVPAALLLAAALAATVMLMVRARRQRA